MSKQRLYLAGGMSDYPFLNFPLFFAIADLLEAQGYEVHNPAAKEADGVLPSLFSLPSKWGGRSDTHPSEIRRRDLEDLLACDGVAVLPLWEDSWGACWEVASALAIGMPVYEVQDLKGSLVRRTDLKAPDFFHAKGGSQHG